MYYIMSYLREYLTRQDKNVGLNTAQLIITLKKSLIGTSIDAINMVDFSPHSSRVASTSKAKNMEIDLDEIFKRGCFTA